MEPFLTSLFKDQQYDDRNFFLVAGPCVIESEELLETVAREIISICKKLGIPFIFKSSYRKANRTSAGSFTGIGDEKALGFLNRVSKKFGVPSITDIHSEREAVIAASYTDVLQIPAFLCRQTDLLEAAGKTGKIVNVKKGQFVSGKAMKFAVEKIKQTGNNHIMLTERGTTFGYQDLVVDYRNIQDMKSIGVPVIMDCTHSLQKPNQVNGVTGGDPSQIGTMANAAIAVGADGVFIETHPDPACALSDGANMLKLDLLETLLEKLVKIRKAVIN